MVDAKSSEYRSLAVRLSRFLLVLPLLVFFVDDEEMLLLQLSLLLRSRSTDKGAVERRIMGVLADIELLLVEENKVFKGEGCLRDFVLLLLPLGAFSFANAVCRVVLSWLLSCCKSDDSASKSGPMLVLEEMLFLSVVRRTWLFSLLWCEYTGRASSVLSCGLIISSSRAVMGVALMRDLDLGGFLSVV